MLFAAVSVLRDGWSVLSITGDCDLASGPDLRRQLQQAATASDRLVVDLSGVSFIDSVGLGLIVGARRRAGEMVVVAPEGAARRALESSLLDQILDVRDAFPPA